MISMTAKVLGIALVIGTAAGGTAIWHARQTPEVADARDWRQAGRKDMDLRGVNLEGADLGGVDVQSLFLHVQWTGRITITQELQPNTATKSQTGKRVATYDIIADIRGAEGSHGPPTITASESSSHVEAHERCWSETIEGKISPDRSRDRKPDWMMFETGPVGKDHYWFSVLLVSPEIPVKGRRNELCGGTWSDISREDQINVQTKPKMNSIAFTAKNSSGTVEDAEGNSNGEWKTTLSWNFTIKPVAYDTAPLTPLTPPPPSSSSPPPTSVCVDFLNDEDLKKLYREAQAEEMNQSALEKLANQLAAKYYHLDSYTGTFHVLDPSSSPALAISTIGHELVHRVQLKRPPPGDESFNTVKLKIWKLEALSWENSEGKIAEDVASAIGPNKFFGCIDEKEQEVSRLGLACAKVEALQALQSAVTGLRGAQMEQSLKAWKDPWFAAWLRNHPNWKTEIPARPAGGQCEGNEPR